MVELIEKSLTGASDHLVDLFETPVAAVVGVGDILWFFEGGVVGSYEGELGFWCAEFDQVAFVACVHRDDVLESFDVDRGVELAGALIGEVDVEEGCGLDGAGVWGVAYMPITGAAGVDEELVGEVVLIDEVLEDAVGEGGAADVSEADEEDGGLVRHGFDWVMK